MPRASGALVVSCADLLIRDVLRLRHKLRTKSTYEIAGLQAL
jgi:hypothetical protein